MKLYPESASVQLEFEKIKHLVSQNCECEYAKQKAENLRIHTKKEYIDLELQQSHEYKLLLEQSQYFPNEYILNISREIKLLGIEGGSLSADDFLQIRKLAGSIEKIFHWFDRERLLAYPALAQVISGTYYEKMIAVLIDDIIDEGGNIKDNASPELQRIRTNLFRKRNELRKVFEKVVARLNKAGYSADIEEGFSHGRRVVAVFSEHKRQVKGILHGESDSRKTSFIEPEETIELNNDVFALENDERKEVQRILRDLTAQLSIYSPLLFKWYEVVGEFDFIYAKARFAIEINGNYPNIIDRAHLELKDAYHPLLFLYNKKAGKETVPVTLELSDEQRILVISGPNAGGKTVTMKTVGINQLMIQSGLLVPVHPSSQFGIFKQLFIHIGDTQNIEFDLSTYSSHLLHMKYFIEHANGRTLFFIDELGSGSDPSLGGSFAEVILEELSKKHAFGIVTTHYLNLKVMANHTAGLVNAAMAFDERHLQPLYRLITGKPGSSYTFAIAERIGLPKQLINRARNLVDEGHFRLDKLLDRTEQDRQWLDKEKKELQKLLQENNRLQREMEIIMGKERHRQQLELLKHRNKITEERIANMKETERKLKQIVLEWKKTENKDEVMKQIQHLLFRNKDEVVTSKLSKKIEAKYQEVNGIITVGAKVKMKKNPQVGIVKEIRGKRALVQIGLLPMSVELKELIMVEEKHKTAT